METLKELIHIPIYTRGDLYHHGIPNQKWGVRNGPPYPLNQSAKSAAEKKAEKSLDKGSEKSYNKNRRGKNAVNKALSQYGQLKAGSSSLYGSSEKGKEAVDAILLDRTKVPRVGKSPENIDRRMVSKINDFGNRNNDISRQRNCVSCAVAYILNSLFEMKTIAKPYHGVDEKSGMVAKAGRPLSILNAVFEGVKVTKFDKPQDVNNIIRNISNNTTGVLAVQGPRGNHVVNYEKDKSGNATIIDSQMDFTFSDSDNMSINDFSQVYKAVGIFDMSDASIKNGTDETLDLLIKR